MTIVFDNYVIPEHGRLDIRATVDLVVSAQEARRLVDRWLLESVSVLIGASMPTLVIGEQIVWRVPVWMGLVGSGRTELGVIDVDVTSGTLLDVKRRASAIMAAAEIHAGKTLSFAPRPALTSSWQPDPLAYRYTHVTSDTN